MSDPTPSTITRLLGEIPMTETAALAVHARIQAGVPGAAGELVVGYARLIASLVRRASPQGAAQFEDFLAAAMAAGLVAARQWRPEVHGPFAALLPLHVHSAISAELRSSSAPVTLPKWWVTLCREVRALAGELEQGLGRAPLAGEVAAAVNVRRQAHGRPVVALERVELALNPQTFVRLDRPSERTDGSGRRSDCSPLEKLLSESAEEGAQHLAVEGANSCERLPAEELLQQLEPREQAILRWRFGFDGPPQDRPAIGRRLGLTGERVRQIESGAMRRLRFLSRPKVAGVA